MYLGTYFRRWFFDYCYILFCSLGKFQFYCGIYSSNRLNPLLYGSVKDLKTLMLLINLLNYLFLPRIYELVHQLNLDNKGKYLL